MTALMILGSAIFDVTHHVSGSEFEGEKDFAEHKVLGGDRLYENMTGGEASRTIKGVTFPMDPEYGSGADIIQRLEAMRERGIPQPLMRGDGAALGWYLITKVKAEGAYLAYHGVPHELKFSVQITRCDAPLATDFASIIESFFG